jgi:hypothetical protein
MNLFDEIYGSVLFYSVRLIFIVIGLYIGYYIISQRFLKKMDNLCLINTSNCMTIEVYRHKNTFLARDDVSQIWFWYNGFNLYVYGQANGTCQSYGGQSYEAVNVFQMSLGQNENEIQFSALPNQCIDGYRTILNYYQNELKAKMEPFIIKRANPTQVINIYSIVQSMYDSKIFKFK